MANIQTFLQNILSARYGKDVRQSIHDAIEEVDRVADTAQGSATEAAAEAEQYRNETEQLRNEVAEIVPEGYSDLVEQVNENTIKVDTIIEKADLGIKETASGEEIHLTDSAEGKAVEFALFGKARQNTTQGNQLLDVTNYVARSDITINIEDLGKKVTAKGKNSRPAAAYILNIMEYAGKTITLKAKRITKSVNTPIFIGFVIKYGNGATIYKSINESNLSTTVEFPSDLTFLEFHINVNDTATAIDTENVVIIEELMVSEKSDAEWESFSGGQPSPAPSYPQPIEVSGASGSVTVKSVGKNLVENFTNDGFTNQYGVILYVKADLKPSTRYTLSFKDVIGNIYYVNESLIKDFTTVTTSEITSVTFTTKDILDTRQYSSNKGWYLLKNYINQPTAPDFSEVMLCEEYITDSTYEPYKETLSTIPTENGLAGIKVSSGGNYTDSNGQQWICDEIVKYADGSGKKIQRVGKDVYDNSSDEVFSYSTITNRTFVNTSKPYKINTVPLCTHCSRVLCWSDDLTSVWLETGITLDSFKNIIENNPMTLWYQLETPIETPLTAEEIAEIEKLHTFYPITNISNDFECGMKVKYNADSKNYIDKHLAEMERAREQAMMSMFLLLPEETQAAMIENDVNNLLAESEN